MPSNTLKEALEEIQWQKIGSNFPCCAVCGGFAPFMQERGLLITKDDTWGHTPDCKIKAALSAQETIPETPEVRDALEKSVQALHDWVLTYAPEFCDPLNVRQAHERIREGGGTLAYITDVRQQAETALAPPPEARGEAEWTAKEVAERECEAFHKGYLAARTPTTPKESK